MKQILVNFNGYVPRHEWFLPFDLTTIQLYVTNPIFHTCRIKVSTMTVLNKTFILRFFCLLAAESSPLKTEQWRVKVLLKSRENNGFIHTTAKARPVFCLDSPDVSSHSLSMEDECRLCACSCWVTTFWKECNH